ncbi:hypothetical protein KIN12_13300, partial [Vibrio cholerae]|uniref:hypothetical protein n=1 Tax=Bacillus anthracis TaxID=1392 RepID=UPI001BCFDB3F
CHGFISIPMKIPTILYKACNQGIAIRFYGLFPHMLLLMPCKCKSCGIPAAFLYIFLMYKNGN